MVLKLGSTLLLGICPTKGGSIPRTRDKPPTATAQEIRELGFEGVVAKNHSSLYRPNHRGWVKVKNLNYWRRDAEREAMTRKHERRAGCASDSRRARDG